MTPLKHAVKFSDYEIGGEYSFYFYIIECDNGGDFVYIDAELHEKLIGIARGIIREFNKGD